MRICGKCVRTHFVFTENTKMILCQKDFRVQCHVCIQHLGIWICLSVGSSTLAGISLFLILLQWLSKPSLLSSGFLILFTHLSTFLVSEGDLLQKWNGSYQGTGSVYHHKGISLHLYFFLFSWLAIVELFLLAKNNSFTYYIYSFLSWKYVLNTIPSSCILNLFVIEIWSGLLNFRKHTLWPFIHIWDQLILSDLLIYSQTSQNPVCAPCLL